MKKLFEAMKNREWTKLEIGLSLTVAFLSGIIIGNILSPKGERYYGCFNGNSTIDELPLQDEEK